MYFANSNFAVFALFITTAVTKIILSAKFDLNHVFTLKNHLFRNREKSCF